MIASLIGHTTNCLLSCSKKKEQTVHALQLLALAAIHPRPVPYISALSARWAEQIEVGVFCARDGTRAGGNKRRRAGNARESGVSGIAAADGCGGGGMATAGRGCGAGG